VVYSEKLSRRKKDFTRGKGKKRESYWRGPLHFSGKGPELSLLWEGEEETLTSRSHLLHVNEYYQDTSFHSGKVIWLPRK